MSNFLIESKRKILKDSVIKNDYEIKKGPSEELFYQYLIKYSKFEVFKSLEHKSYQPDLVVIFRDLVLDIEIDEPYIYSSKEPIHFDDIDRIRDFHFKKSGFTVVRFTEDQVLENPNICLMVLEHILESLSKLNELSINTEFHQIVVPIWTHEDAFRLAYNNSRGIISNRIENFKKNHL